MIKPRFKLPGKIIEIRDLNYGHTIEFAYSDIVSQGGIKYHATRIINRIKSADLTTQDEGIKWGSRDNKKDSLQTRKYMIRHGEDPRLFFHGENAFMYFIEYEDSKASDCKNYIVDLEKNLQSELRSLTQFSGKNWIPFSLNPEIYFIYSLEPLSVLKLEKKGDYFQIVAQSNQEKFTKAHWGDDKKIFSQIRGGTPFIRVSENEYLSLTHITPTGHFKGQHRIGALLFELKSGKFIHATLSRNLIPNQGLDPFSIMNKIGENTQIQVWLSSVLGNLHEETSFSQSFLISFETQRIVEFVKRSGKELKGTFDPSDQSYWRG